MGNGACGGGYGAFEDGAGFEKAAWCGRWRIWRLETDLGDLESGIVEEAGEAEGGEEAETGFCEGVCCLGKDL